MKKIELAISTCPNDTFAFHALMNGLVDTDGCEFNTQLMDISHLNAGLFRGDFDVAKSSFHAAARLANETVVLPSGSALGFGVGPLLLAAESGASPGESNAGEQIVLCPGEHTTATMLFRIFYAEAIADGKIKLEQTLFSDIMPRLEKREADFGVCIHEGRFTYAESGLGCVEDLGLRWENETSSPLPLGGIIARRSLGTNLIGSVAAVIKRSIEWGIAHPDQTLPTMQKYAQEFSDDVLMQHVELYVNDWTVDLGEVGRRALTGLSEKAKECEIIPAGSENLEVWQN